MPERSRFVTLLAGTSIMLMVYFSYQGISNLRMMQSLQERPEYRIAEQMMPSMSVSPAAIYGELSLYLLGIAASIAMVNRLNWGRVMYMIVLSVSTVWEIVSSISSYLSLSHYLNVVGMGDSFAVVLFGNVLIAGFNIAIVWKLSTKTIKAEFV
jgi:hypothetical protein